MSTAAYRELEDRPGSELTAAIKRIVESLIEEEQAKVLLSVLVPYFEVINLRPPVILRRPPEWEAECRLGRVHEG